MLPQDKVDAVRALQAQGQRVMLIGDGMNDAPASAAAQVIAATFITGLAIWDLAGTLPLPLGVLGHEGSTVIVGLNGLRLLSTGVWRRALRG